MNPTEHAQAMARFAAASGRSDTDVLLVIASLVMVFTVLWVAWITLRLFNRWHEGTLESAEFLWYALRACMILTIIGYHVR